MTPDQIFRFWKRVDKDGPTDCWLWLGSSHRQYGKFDRRMAHRIAWELEVGPIPDGLVIDHLCRVKNCVNPAHLEPVTSAENGRRNRGHCTNTARYRRLGT